MANLQCRIWPKIPIQVRISVPKMGKVTMIRDLDPDQNPSPCKGTVFVQYNAAIRLGVRIKVRIRAHVCLAM